MRKVKTEGVKHTFKQVKVVEHGCRCWSARSRATGWRELLPGNLFSGKRHMCTVTGQREAGVREGGWRARKSRAAKSLEGKTQLTYKSQGERR